MVRATAALAAVSLALVGVGIIDPPTASAQQTLDAAGAAMAARGPAINYGTARLDRRLVALRATGPITLDGVLDELAWNDAPVAGQFLQNDPREGAPATYDTEVRVLYDDDALYFGVFARDDEPWRIIVNDIKKDFNTRNSDAFTIILDTFHDERNGYQFSTNPAGAKWDAQMSNEDARTTPAGTGSGTWPRTSRKRAGTPRCGSRFEPSSSTLPTSRHGV